MFILIASILLSGNSNLLIAQIGITGFSPASGAVGTSVTITGTNFDTMPSNNIVFFGATSGIITSGTSNSLTVKLPAGNTFDPPSVTNKIDKVTAIANTPFLSTFPCGDSIGPASFGDSVTYPAGNSPGSVRICDLNGDGLADIIMANSTDSTISILENTSGLGFGIISFASAIDLTGKSGPQGVIVQDMNGDGKPEILAVSKDSNMLTVFKNTHLDNSISFNFKANIGTGTAPKSIAVSDFDGDGTLDVVVANEGDNTISIFKCLPSPIGGFIFNARVDYSVGTAPGHVAARDMDGDNKPDIIVTNYLSNTISVFRNISVDTSIAIATKVDFATSNGPNSFSIADLNGDAKLDIVTANKLSNTISIYQNTSTIGLLSYAPAIDVAVGIAPTHVEISDLDGDGIADLAVTNNGSNTLTVIKNNSAGGVLSLKPNVDIATSFAPDGLSIGDINGDGRPELAVTNGSNFTLHANQVYAGPNLTGTTSQIICSGTSANITLTANSPASFAWVADDNASTTGESITSQNSNTINDVLINTSSSPQTVTYHVTPTSQGDGCVGDAQPVTIVVNPGPDANAGVDTTLSCTNPTIALIGSSLNTSVSYQWNTPLNTTSNTQSVTATVSGIYVLTVTDNGTLCTRNDSVLVSYDTVKPIVTCPLSYQITDCIPGTVTINGTTDNGSDSIKWFGSGIPITNPAVISNQNNYLLWTKRNSNGCVTTQTVSVTLQLTLPVLLTPAGMDTIPAIPILDTVTCSHDTVLLAFQGSTVSSIISIVRPSPMNDTVANNSTTLFPGIYKALITDTVTGCAGNPLLFEVKQYTTLPQLLMPSIIPPFNCSYTSAVLIASSGTPNTTIQWTGPNNFSTLNPATATQAGDYICSVTNPANGCVKSDTLSLIHEHVLNLNSTADTSICSGDSILLTCTPIGGTPNFIYAWNSNGATNSTLLVNPADTVQYVVAVVDSTGCSGTDTVFVNVPTPLNDSTLTFILCDSIVASGQIQIYATNGVIPYQYSITGGQSFQSSSVFANLTYGAYPIVITDAMNCSHSDSATVNALSHKPITDFIVSTNMMQLDSFVVVDISNPRPDTVIWIFPNTVTVVDNNPYAPVIVSADTGSVIISMETHYGTCIMSLTKTVQFIKADTIAPSPNGNGIEAITVFPNPNTGQFSVEVKLYKKQTYAIYVYNSQGVEQTRITIPYDDYSLSNINLPAPAPGTYLLKVIAEYDSEAKTIVITQ